MPTQPKRPNGATTDGAKRDGEAPLVWIRTGFFFAINGLLYFILIDPPANLPELESGAGAFATGLLGLSVNPKAEAKMEEFWLFAVRCFAYLAPAALAVLAGIWMYHSDNKAAGGVLAGAIAGLGGLSLDTANFTLPQGKKL
ncbi:hypothetical protein ACGF13_34505 [Kitasatospora sp. NPDC048286]|uniref:hypothetical protein n=1 Tax=Kitasatospora sp. NPDC048286 TaxID=3364047 RepID=UPI0037243AFA